MNPAEAQKIRRINCLTSEMESLYHQASQKLGMSDSVSKVLYMIYDTGEEACPLAPIYKKTGLPKQTVNSAIRSLETSGMLYLEPCGGRSKKILLTDKGRTYVRETVARIYRAEIQVLSTWSEEELLTYLSLTEKYVAGLKEQFDRW